MLLKLSSKQEAAIAAGKVKRSSLIRSTKQAANQTQEDDGPVHYYIYGPSGIGKTYNAEKAVKESGVLNTTVSGNVSMIAFGIDLAVTKYMFPKDKVVIIIDDCDEILKDSKCINQMKELLGKNKYSYNKRFHINSYAEEGTETYTALEAATVSNGVGFEVDTSNFTFLITSNIRLSYDDTAEAICDRNGGLDTSKSIRARHLAAIRGRCETKDLDMTMEEKWGNLAAVTLEEDLCNKCNEQETLFILNYLWNNWDKMKETSIRTVSKMARTLKFEEPDNIMDAFDADFLK
tara:strand:+ start:57 stop:929 length:873 start_codon:yes stop_codon:yes gene_type:complete